MLGTSTTRNRFLKTNPGMMGAIASTAKESVIGQVNRSLEEFGFKGIDITKVERLVVTATQDSAHGEKAAEVMFLLKDALHAMQSHSGGYLETYLPAGTNSGSPTIRDLHVAHMRNTVSIQSKEISGVLNGLELLEKMDTANKEILRCLDSGDHSTLIVSLPPKSGPVE